MWPLIQLFFCSIIKVLVRFQQNPKRPYIQKRCLHVTNTVSFLPYRQMECSTFPLLDKPFALEIIFLVPSQSYHMPDDKAPIPIYNNTVCYIPFFFYQAKSRFLLQLLPPLLLKTN